MQIKTEFELGSCDVHVHTRCPPRCLTKKRVQIQEKKKKNLMNKQDQSENLWTEHPLGKLSPARKDNLPENQKHTF